MDAETAGPCSFCDGTGINRPLAPEDLCKRDEKGRRMLQFGIVMPKIMEAAK